MINNTKLRIPKKYEHMIDEVNHDSTGYWVNLAEGYYSAETGCHTIHETSQKATLEQIRNIQKETYDLKDVDGTYIATDMPFEQAVEIYKRTTRGQDMHSRQTRDSVEKLWDIKNLKRDEGILLDEAMEDLEELKEILADCKDMSYLYGKLMSKEELEIEYNKLRDEINQLIFKVKKDMEQDVEDAVAKHIAEEIEKEINKDDN